MKCRKNIRFHLTLLGLAIIAGQAMAAIPPKSTFFIPKFKNWGLFNSESDSHIRATEAWKLEEGSRDVIVAVIDTGIDPKHKDLAPNLWKNPKRTPNANTGLRQVDEYGFDFVTNKPNPIDDHSHGSHVAGIIGAVADPDAGVSGVAHRVSIMPIKYYSKKNSGSVNLANTIKAFDYAIEHGARIINYSGGGPVFSQDEYLALKKAEAHGILLVVAAGNEQNNIDSGNMDDQYYPASYKLSNMIAVSAIDKQNKLLPSSNWGQKSVDIAAPGEGIYSTVPGNRFDYMSGTSQATAFVTGVAALLLAKDSSLTPQQIKNIIKSSADPVSGLSHRVASGGRLNAYKALTEAMHKGVAPSKPNLAAFPSAELPPMNIQ